LQANEAEQWMLPIPVQDPANPTSDATPSEGLGVFVPTYGLPERTSMSNMVVKTSPVATCKALTIFPGSSVSINFLTSERMHSPATRCG
jgi:hypothetical protein